MSNIQVTYPWLSNRENNIINVSEELSKSGTPTQKQIADKLEQDHGYRVSEQYVGRILKKHREKKREQSLVAVEGKDMASIQKEVSDKMHNLAWQASKRDEWMTLLENDLDNIRDQLSDAEQILGELKTHIDSIWVDPQKSQVNWSTLVTIRQLLTKKNSPLNTMGKYEIIRKHIGTLDRLINSQNEALYKLIMAQKNILTTNPEDLPDEKQEELIRWYIKNLCKKKCPGNSYREQEILRKRKEREDERRRMRLGQETVVDVDYGDVDE